MGHFTLTPKRVMTHRLRTVGLTGIWREGMRMGKGTEERRSGKRKHMHTHTIVGTWLVPYEIMLEFNHSLFWHIVRIEI